MDMKNYPALRHNEGHYVNDQPLFPLTNDPDTQRIVDAYWQKRHGSSRSNVGPNKQPVDPSVAKALAGRNERLVAGIRAHKYAERSDPFFEARAAAHTKAGINTISLNMNGDPAMYDAKVSLDAEGHVQTIGNISRP